MNILITTVRAPFVSGGAELHAKGLRQACIRRGHRADIVVSPFRFEPPGEVQRYMDLWEGEDFTNLDDAPDIVICLKFPTYYLRHHHKVVWLLHQHRGVYDLWDHETECGKTFSEAEHHLKARIQEKDTFYLQKARALFANSANVANRLMRYNGLAATPLYHPPPLDGLLYHEKAEPFIFAPGRIEPLKRQELLIKAMRLVRAPLKAIITGEGSKANDLRKLVTHLGMADRILFPGRVSKETLLSLYARCFAVFFGPYDEDYGYVTLEAMLAKKPVITCTDSGGPLEFIQHQKTGFCLPPAPEDLAGAIEELFKHQDWTAGMGHEAYNYYQSLNLSWDRVLDRLFGNDKG